MAKTATRKVGLAIRAGLYAELSKLAKRNGQTRSFLLEKALEHYIQVVAPSQSTVRPQVMEQFRRSVDKNRELHRLLAR